MKIIKSILLVTFLLLLNQFCFSQFNENLKIYKSDASTEFLRISEDGKVIVFGDKNQFSVFDLENQKTKYSESRYETYLTEYEGKEYKVKSNNYKASKAGLLPGVGISFDPNGSTWMHLIRQNSGEKAEFFNYETKETIPEASLGRRDDMKCNNHWFIVDEENRNVKFFENGSFKVKPDYSGEFLPLNSKKSTYSYFFNNDYAYFPLKTEKDKLKVYNVIDLKTKEEFNVAQYIPNTESISLPKGNAGNWISVKDQSSNEFIINPIIKHYVPVPKGSSTYEIEFIKEYNVLVFLSGITSTAWVIDGTTYNPLQNINDFINEPSSESVYSEYLEGYLKYKKGVLYLLSFKDFTENELYDFRWKPESEQQKEKQEAELLAKKIEEDQQKKEEEAKKAIASSPKTGPELIEDPIPFPQNYVEHPLYDKSMQFTDASSWKEAELYWIEFSKRYPDVDVGYFYSAEAKFFLTKYKEALNDFDQAYQMNPLKNRYIVTYLSCIGALQLQGIGADLGKNMAAISDPSLYQTNLDVLNNRINLNGTSSPYSVPLINARRSYVDHYQNINANDQFYEKVSSVFGIQGKTVEEVWQRMLSIKQILKTREANPTCFTYLLKDYYLFLDSKPKYKDWFQLRINKELASEYNEISKEYIYFKTYAGEALYRKFIAQSDYEKASILIDKLIEDLTSSGLFKFKLLQLYQYKAKLLYVTDRKTEFTTLAVQLEKLNTEYKNPNFDIVTNEMLALLYKKSDFNRSEKYALNALSLSQKHQTGDEHRIKSLLSIIYFDNGMMDKGLEYTGVKGNLDEMNPLQLFNAASMLEDMDKLNEARDLYLKSIAKFNKSTEGKSERVLLTERAEMEPVYSGLASVYSKQEKYSEAFEIVEQSKAQGLSKDLLVGEVSLKEIQTLLSPDEAFVSYKILDPSNFLIIIATKDNVESDIRSLRQLVNPIKNNFSDVLLKLDAKLSQSVYQNPNYIAPKGNLSDDAQLNIGDFELMIEFYRSYLTKELNDYLVDFKEQDLNEIGETMQESLYGTFVWPFEQAISKKKKYYLSLDGVLNFIPFETFRNQEGYLAQTAEYVNITSAGILKVLKNREYNTPRKSVIAFGGATYALPKTDVENVKTLSEVRDWQLKSFELVEQNKSLTNMFSALGYGKMNYLQGTLNEVKEIGIINDDARIVIGEEMNEKNIKTLSSTGELKKYKVVHFATHGWAISSLPSVSGLAMTIPEVSVDGEDGRLISKEISNLDLNADMVMLSACQTGLGKLYGSEGVIGLNQSLLKAGANSTIVSLWPVNDYATSILVKELYKIAKENGGDYSQALLQVKRNFITGKYDVPSMSLRHPIYWAPFVYNGK